MEAPASYGLALGSGEYNTGRSQYAGGLISCNDPHFPVRSCGHLVGCDKWQTETPTLSDARLLAVHVLFLVSFVQRSPF